MISVDWVSAAFGFAGGVIVATAVLIWAVFWDERHQ